MRGECLCGGVEFEVRDPPQRLYQCHCSLCRKQSGAASNAAFIVRGEQLVWLAGQELISSYVKPSGFRSDFCSKCGSPVPNPLRDTSFVWVPVGLLEGSTTLSIAMHLFIGSKASWEPSPVSGTLHEEMPVFSELLKELRS
jgi:hypothetical protein